MQKDLTNSLVERKNILNNNFVIQDIYNQIGFSGVLFEGKYIFTKQQVSKFFEVEVRTIERLLENYGEELNESGYEIFSGSRLRELRSAFLETFTVENDYVTDIDVGNIVSENELINPKAPNQGIFTYKAFLNIGMLLTDSDRAKELRSAILSIVIDALNRKLGGSTKYINQREEEFLSSAIREYNYRQTFTNALDHYIDANKFKYAQLTDKIYLSLFKEDAKEYRQILNLNINDSVRATMYSEILDLIASYENGFSEFLKRAFEEKGRKLRLSEAHLLFKEFEKQTNHIYEPLREKARGLMASRDMAFRDALHEKLRGYVSALKTEDFKKFLGDKSKTLDKRIEENIDVFQRLKDR